MKSKIEKIEKDLSDLDRMKHDLANLVNEKGLNPVAEETVSDAVFASSKAGKSREFLQEAHSIIYGDRHEEYGDAANNFTDIANMWTDYTQGYKFRKEDVAFMMIMVKIARCHYKITEDSLRDIVGYCTILHRFKFLDDDGLD